MTLREARVALEWARERRARAQSRNNVQAVFGWIRAVADIEAAEAAAAEAAESIAIAEAAEAKCRGRS